MNETSQKTDVSKSDASATPPSTAASPWQSLVELRREMDRMFDDVTSRFAGSRFLPSAFHAEPFSLFTGGGKIAPVVDIVENDKSYTVTAEVPGLAEKDLDVSIADQVLTIKGEKREETEEEKDNYRLSERRYGSLQRSIRLPEDVDAEKIEASYDKGVVTITLPKRAESKAKEKKIPVKGK